MWISPFQIRPTMDFSESEKRRRRRMRLIYLIISFATPTPTINSHNRERANVPHCGRWTDGFQSDHSLTIWVVILPISPLFPSSLYVVPFIFKPVFFWVHSENADENWVEMKEPHTGKLEIKGIWVKWLLIWLGSDHFDGFPSLFIVANHSHFSSSQIVAILPEWYENRGVLDIYTLWGVHSVVIFCRIFLTCSTGRWADTAATVQRYRLP